MLRQKVLDLLRAGPMTLGELSSATGSPPSVLRSALAAEFYDQREINHPEYGRVTAWVPSASALRVDESGRYLLAL